MAPRPSLSGRGADLGGAILGALAIVMASAALGVAVNHFSPNHLPIMERSTVALRPRPPGMARIDLEQAKAAFEAGNALFLDARDPQKYAAGHIPGAHNLPAERFEARFLELAERIERAPQVIVYCESEDCGEAEEVAQRLTESYRGTTLICSAGWNGWERAGYPTTKGEQP